MNLGRVSMGIAAGFAGVFVACATPEFASEASEVSTPAPAVEGDVVQSAAIEQTATPPAVAETSDAGGAVADSRIYPGEVGRTWTYAVYTANTPGTVTPQTMKQSITSTARVDNRDVFVVQTTIGASTGTDYRFNADVDTLLYRTPTDPTWAALTKGPAREGDSWMFIYGASSRVMTWHVINEPVHVAAGTFKSCYSVDQYFLESSRPQDVDYYVYCRGVGLVKRELRRYDGINQYFELTEKNF